LLFSFGCLAGITIYTRKARHRACVCYISLLLLLGAGEIAAYRDVHCNAIKTAATYNRFVLVKEETTRHKIVD
jgi:hypothetical protein